uniref:Uncharacterized protein n=1 Tax=Rhizophagus irregularis (strain DAOM 181602 / DAOM 197198 / MUCL 43194) TaxID=747089 RepID=U9TQH9_RHIID
MTIEYIKNGGWTDEVVVLFPGFPGFPSSLQGKGGAGDRRDGDSECIRFL